MGRDQFVHQRADVRHQLALALRVVGKEGVVRDIGVMRVGPRLGDLAENREAAEPGIEDEDRRRSRHGGSLVR
jgi:hypothetical protein